MNEENQAQHHEDKQPETSTETPEFLPQGTLPRVYHTKPGSPEGAIYTDAAGRKYSVSPEGAMRRVNKPLSKKARRRARTSY